MKETVSGSGEEGWTLERCREPSKDDVNRKSGEWHGEERPSPFHDILKGTSHQSKSRFDVQKYVSKLDYLELVHQGGFCSHRRLRRNQQSDHVKVITVMKYELASCVER